MTPPVTVARSWPSKRERRTATGVTDRLRVSVSVMATGVSAVPAGRRSSSFGAQASFWKSLMSTTSLRGRVDSLTMVPATRSAGE